MVLAFYAFYALCFGASFLGLVLIVLRVLRPTHSSDKTTLGWKRFRLKTSNPGIAIFVVGLVGAGVMTYFQSRVLSMPERPSHIETPSFPSVVPSASPASLSPRPSVTPTFASPLPPIHSSTGGLVGTRQPRATASPSRPAPPDAVPEPPVAGKTCGVSVQIVTSQQGESGSAQGAGAKTGDVSQKANNQFQVGQC